MSDAEIPPGPGQPPPIPPIVISRYIATAEHTRRFAKYDPADGFLTEYGTIAVGFLDEKIAAGDPIIEITIPGAVGLDTHKVDLETLQLVEMTEADKQARTEKYQQSVTNNFPEAVALQQRLVTPQLSMYDVIKAIEEKDNGDPSKWQELLAQTRNTTNGQSP
jgi:hypothetical protein